MGLNGVSSNAVVAASTAAPVVVPAAASAVALTAAQVAVVLGYSQQIANLKAEVDGKELKIRSLEAMIEDIRDQLWSLRASMQSTFALCMR